MPRNLVVLLLACGLARVAWAQEPQPSPEAQVGPSPRIVSSGEDPARPVRRFDVRLNTEQKTATNWESQLTLRVDTIHYDQDWKVYTRADLPIGLATQTGSPAQWGLSDTLLQGFAVTPGEGFNALFGVRVTVPTGTATSLGRGKWTVAPAVGLVWQIPEISEGTYAGVVSWNTTDFAGAGDRKHVNQLTLKPLLHFELGEGWFIQTQPEIRHDNLTGVWFVPLDLMVGRLISDNVVLSLEYQRSLSGYQPNFLQFWEFRTGIFY